MKKFLFVLVVLLIIGSAGEYFYFTTAIENLGIEAAQQQKAVEAANQEALDAQLTLSNIQKDVKTRKALSQELLACQQHTFEAEYAGWPKFLRPNCKGEVEPVRIWIISGVHDLNSVKVVSYHTPTLSAIDKMWHFDVRVFGRRLNDEYGVNIVHFKFFQDSRLNEIRETPEW